MLQILKNSEKARATHGTDHLHCYCGFSWLPGGSTGGVVSEAVSDAYQALREKRVSRFGNETDVVGTIDVLEKKPDSEGARLMFQEEVERAAVDQNPEIRKAARHLQDRLESQPEVSSPSSKLVAAT
jgi:hypothetical protein